MYSLNPRRHVRFSHALSPAAPAAPDVIALQKFFATQYSNFPTPTGYFGALTEAAVKQWQKEHGIVSSGTAATTGWGVVGKRTRAAIAMACAPDTTSTQSQQTQSKTYSSTQTQTTQTSCPIARPPTTFCPTGWQAITNVNGCTVSYQCPAVQPQVQQSCVFNGAVFTNGASIVAYQSSSVPSGQTRISENRACSNGTLSGSYTYASCTVAQAPEKPEVHVATNGSDSNPGTLAAPVLTIGKAKGIAAEKAHRLGVPISVYIHPGTYFVSTPIVFTSADSGTASAPITYSAYPGEAVPVITGALHFTGNSVGTWSNATANTVSGNVPVHVYYFTDPATVALLKNFIAQSRASNSNHGAFSVTQAFIRGTRMIRSRFPNADTTVDVSCLHDAGCSGARQAYFSFPNTSVLYPWLSDGHTEIVFTNLWQQPRAIVSGVNTTGVSAFIDNLSAITGAYWNSGADEVAHFENNLAFLDSAEEWYFDENNLAFYFIASPQDNTATDDFAISLQPTLVSFQGSATAPVQYLNFSSIDFEGAGWAYQNDAGNSNYYSFGQAACGLGGVIDGLYVAHMQFSRDTFERYGQYGISLGGSRTGACRSQGGMASDIAVSLNQFQDGGAGSVRIDNLNHAHTGNVIDSNVINFMGRVFADASALTVWGTSDTKVTYNTIQYAPYSGISLGVGQRYAASDYNLIQGNNISNVMQKLRDGGGIYISGSQGISQNNTIRNVGTSRDADAPQTSPDGYRIGTYLDDYGVYWKILNNIAPTVTSKSSFNMISGNTTDGSTPSPVVSTDGGQSTVPTAWDGTPISTKPTWW